MLVFGAGGGLTLPALAMLGMSAASPADAGTVSGLFNTTQQVGAALGVALLSTLAAARTAHLAVAAGRPGVVTAAALTGGYRLAFVVGTGLAAGALIVALIVLRPAGSPVAASSPAGTSPAAGPAAAKPDTADPQTADPEMAGLEAAGERVPASCG
jgi:hypothetical protein